MSKLEKSKELKEVGDIVSNALNSADANVATGVHNIQYVLNLKIGKPYETFRYSIFPRTVAAAELALLSITGLIELAVVLNQKRRLQEEQSDIRFLTKYYPAEPELQSLLLFYNPETSILMRWIRRYCLHRKKWYAFKKDITAKVLHKYGNNGKLTLNTEWYVKDRLGEWLKKVVSQLNQLPNYSQKGNYFVVDYNEKGMPSIKVKTLTDTGDMVSNISVLAEEDANLASSGVEQVPWSTQLGYTTIRLAKILWKAAMSATLVYWLCVFVVALLGVLLGVSLLTSTLGIALPLAIVAVTFIVLCVINIIRVFYWKNKSLAPTVSSSSKVEQSESQKILEFAKRELFLARHLEPLGRSLPTIQDKKLSPFKHFSRRLRANVISGKDGLSRWLKANLIPMRGRPEGSLNKDRVDAMQKDRKIRKGLRLFYGSVEGLLGIQMIAWPLMTALGLFGGITAATAASLGAVLPLFGIGIVVGCVIAYWRYKKAIKAEKKLHENVVKKTDVLGQLHAVETTTLNYNKRYRKLLVLYELVLDREEIDWSKLPEGCMSADEHFWRRFEPATWRTRLKRWLMRALYFIAGAGTGSLIVRALIIPIFIAAVGGTLLVTHGLFIAITVSILIAAIVMGAINAYDYHKQRIKERAALLLEKNTHLLALAEKEKACYQEKILPCLAEKLGLARGALNKESIEATIEESELKHIQSVLEQMKTQDSKGSKGCSIECRKEYLKGALEHLYEVQQLSPAQAGNDPIANRSFDNEVVSNITPDLSRQLSANTHHNHHTPSGSQHGATYDYSKQPISTPRSRGASRRSGVSYRRTIGTRTPKLTNQIRVQKSLQTQQSPGLKKQYQDKSMRLIASDSYKRRADSWFISSTKRKKQSVEVASPKLLLRFSPQKAENLK